MTARVGAGEEPFRKERHPAARNVKNTLPAEMAKGHRENRGDPPEPSSRQTGGRLTCAKRRSAAVLRRGLAGGRRRLVAGVSGLLVGEAAEQAGEPAGQAAEQAEGATGDVLDFLGGQFANSHLKPHLVD